MNSIIRSLAKESVEQFENSFSKTSKDIFVDKDGKLIHPGEFGQYRENIVKKFIKMFLPGKYSVGSGFIITNNGDVSTQCDVIIYDKDNSPLLESNNNQRFFPIEIVVGVGEIKSNIQTKKECNDYLLKLSEIKKLREKTKSPLVDHKVVGPDFNPIENWADQIFTFVICNKFDFSFDENSLDYEVDDRFKHNVIFSINDGTCSYQTKNKKYQNLYSPIFEKENLEYYWMPKTAGDISNHYLAFINCLRLGITQITTLKLDLIRYLTNDTYVPKNVNEK